MHILQTTLFLPKQHADEYWAPWKQCSVWCMSHMSKSPRQKKLSSVPAIFFSSLDAQRPAVSVRLLCEGSTPGSPHLPVPSIRCSSWLFELSCWDTANRCLYLPGPRGRFRGRSDIIISHFKLACPQTRHTISCIHAQPEVFSWFIFRWSGMFIQDLVVICL